MQKITFLIISVFILLSNVLFAQHLKKDGTPDRRYKENRINNSSSSGYKPRTHYRKTIFSTRKHNTNTTYSYGVKRNANGKIHRSQGARRAFMRQTGYPRGRRGYVIDHIIPLKRGGCDCPSNMQWQTIRDAKAKDKVEEP